MTFLHKLRRDERGASAIEMAFALPILLLFVGGIFQLGVILQANAGMQHALGEGARLATIFPVPTDGTISTRMSTALVPIKVGTFTAPSVTTPPTSECTNCRQLSISYSVTPNFIFFTTPPITLTRGKRVYQSEPVT